jgi:nicotinamidase-related amidase
MVMRSLLSRAGLVAVLLATGGCASAAQSEGAGGDSSGDPGTAGGSGSSSNANSSSSSGDDNGSSLGNGSQPSGSVPSATTPTGIIVIDVQSTFVTTATSRNPSADIAMRVANDKQMLDLATSTKVPFFITYELQNTGDHAIAPALAGDLPPGAQAFIKTTFDATGQAQFDAAIHASGLHRFIVVGSETDVCVMQTILGLRREGFEVLAAVDGIFTEEVNATPALRRWTQNGVAQVTVADAPALLAGGPSPTSLVPTHSGPPVIVKPFEIGFVLYDLANLGNDPYASAKEVRLEQLLWISEWFKIPIYAADPSATTAALTTKQKGILTHPILALSSKPSTITQLAFAGSHAGAGSAATTLVQSGVDVFMLEDILYSGTSADLESSYVAGAVPSTYKTLYYELIHSVVDAGWPSQQWVKDGVAKYYDATLAPEELPPIPGP